MLNIVPEDAQRTWFAVVHLQFEVSPHVFDWFQIRRLGRATQSITVTPFCSKNSSLSSLFGKSIDLLEAIIPATMSLVC